MSVLLFSLNASAENVYNESELYYSGDILVTREDIPVTGIVKEYYDNGKLRSETEYKDGKENGVRKYYYESGNLKSETEYKDGKRNVGEKWYYENGNLKAETNYKDGKRNGVEKWYYENGKLEHEYHYINGEKVDIVINEKNPNMQYAKKCDIASHINKLSKEMSGNPKAYYGDNAISALSEHTSFDKKKVRELLSQNNKCAGNIHNLDWTFKCEKSERKHSVYYESYYDQNCLMSKGLWRMDCYRNAGSAGMYFQQVVQSCDDLYNSAAEKCLKSNKVENVYDTCEGDKKLILENGYKNIVFMVDSFEQPDLKDIDYISVVQALLKKYGPVRSSKRKITKDGEKYEIFYWLDGGWVIQVEVKVDDFTDTSKVYSLDTYYMNFPNCIAQAKYDQEEERRRIAAEQEAERRRIAEELAEKERIRKAKEEKNKNFEL